jgi:hypothetical protein
MDVPILVLMELVLKRIKKLDAALFNINHAACSEKTKKFDSCTHVQWLLRISRNFP